MPYKTKKQQNAWRRDHPEVSKRWRDKNLEQRRDIESRYRYGVSISQARRLRKRKCMICGKKAKKMCIDHEGPARVFNQDYRGVLCQQCNVRLGWFEKLHKKILGYLKHASKVKSAANRNGNR